MLFNPIIGGGIKLPSLTNPAAAADIMQNKQAIDQSGQIIVGTKAPLPILSNPGSAGDLLSGKQLIDQNGNALTGTIPSKGASNLSASGATIIVPAGYYPSQVSKSVATATQATPTISVNSSGLITASATQSEGYVSAGTKSATQQLSVKTSSDVTASGATVTVPAGYYTSQVSKSVATATQATPSISVSTAGLITASATQSAGYVSSGTKSATKQLTTQAGKTITPGTSQQTAVASGRYTTGTVYVAGDSNLKAENIKSGVSIFGVTGTSSGGVADYSIDHVTATDNQLIEFDVTSISSYIRSESDVIYGLITYMGLTDVSRDPDYQIISMAFIYDASDLENGGRGRYIQYISSATEVDYDPNDLNFVFNYNMSSGTFRIYSDNTNYTFATADTYRLVLFYTSYS